MSETVDPLDLDSVDMNALEAALALLDNCVSLPVASPANSDPNWTFEELCDSRTDNTIEDRMETRGGAEKQSRKRLRKYQPEVEKLRRQRKRAERQDLERQAERLEQQLAVAKTRARSRRRPSNADDGLAKAQELNQQLKKLLAAHKDASECIHRLFSELVKSTEQVVNKVAKSTERLDTSRFVSAPIEPELFNTRSPHTDLARVAHSIHRAARLDIDSVFGPVNSMEVSKSTRIRPVGEGANCCFEMVTTTPLDSDLRQVTQSILSWITAKRYRNINEVTYSTLAVHGGDDLTEARSNVTFGGALESTRWHCVSVSEMREQPDRFVTVGTMMTAHPSGTVRFREEVWTLVTRSPVDPLHKTFVRMCYRLTTEYGSVAGDDSDTTKLRNDPLYLRAHRQLVERKTTKLVDLQRALLRDSGQDELCALAGL